MQIVMLHGMFVGALGLWALREAAFMAAVSGVWKAPRPCALVFMLGINESHNGTVH